MEFRLNFTQKPSQTPKLLLATKMFYAASGMNVSQVGADAEHLPSRAKALTSLAESLFLFASQIKIEEKGFRIAAEIQKI